MLYRQPHVYNFESCFNCFQVDTFEAIVGMVVTCHCEFVIDERCGTSFGLAYLVLPWVGPEFDVVCKCFGFVLTEVVNDYCCMLFGFVAVPPLIGKL